MLFLSGQVLVYEASSHSPVMTPHPLQYSWTEGAFFILLRLNTYTTVNFTCLTCHYKRNPIKIEIAFFVYVCFIKLNIAIHILT